MGDKGNRFSLRWGNGPEDISKHNLSYRDKLAAIKETYGKDSIKAALELCIDTMYMQSKGEIIRFTKSDVEKLIQYKDLFEADEKEKGVAEDPKKYT